MLPTTHSRLPRLTLPEPITSYSIVMIAAWISSFLYPALSPALHRATCPIAHGLYAIPSHLVDFQDLCLRQISFYGLKSASDVECPSFKTCFVKIVNFQCCYWLIAMLRALCFSSISFSRSTPGPLPLMSIRLSTMHHKNVQYGHRSTNIGIRDPSPDDVL
ncbi:hypothetical protein EDD22DRAFT_395402 [Suillus occidentalis]|nr:hypothetical protein EDD22DRAFT_395402 [Suillus occidentalis]